MPNTKTGEGALPMSSYIDRILRDLRANVPDLDSLPPLDLRRMHEEEARAAAREIRERARARQAEDILELKAAGNIDPRLTFAAFLEDKNNSAALGQAHIFATTYKSTPERCALLYVQGNPGSGKTFLVQAVANEIIDRAAEEVHCCRYDEIRRAFYFNFQDSDGERQQTRQLLDLCNSVPLLIIEDLCTCGGGLGVSEQRGLAELLRTRRRAGLPLAITTELMPAALQERVGNLCYESIKEYSTIFAGLLGKSRRRDISLPAGALA
ncbi:MAG: hypothetical protein K6A65_00700 [Succinivibrionaceae bacterium]|nr:hypothetical protein [Succinivibrionaceae bacterium]